WGSVNHPVSPAVFDQLLGKAMAHLAQRELYVFDGYAGASESERLGLRVITEKAWHALFATTLFIRPSNGELSHHHADFTLINAGALPAGGPAPGLRSDVLGGLDFSRRIALILATEHAAETKKAISSAMNYLWPRKGT